MEHRTSHLVSFLYLTVLKGKDGPDVRPVYWEDNYSELMPGDKRERTANYPRKLLGGAKPYIKVDGWNVRALSEP